MCVIKGAYKVETLLHRHIRGAIKYYNFRCIPGEISGFENSSIAGTATKSRRKW
jgi:hypothetical protein